MGIIAPSNLAACGSKTHFQSCGMAYDGVCCESGRNRSYGRFRFLFIETKETESSYPIPAAFAAYAEYLDIALGEEKYRKGKEV